MAFSSLAFLRSTGEQSGHWVWAHPWAQIVHGGLALTDTGHQQRLLTACSGSTGREALIRNGMRPRSLRTRRLEGRGGARPLPVASTPPRQGPRECRRWETSRSRVPSPVIEGRPDEWQVGPAECRRTLGLTSPKLSDRSSVQHLVQHLTANRGICRSITATDSAPSQP